jgi:NAD(P)-dependent dehydrogenase (short-subunit alcohol dehydrogenase family)
MMLEYAAIKRLMEPEEVTAMAHDLRSPETRNLTGFVFTMDAGWSAR